MAEGSGENIFLVKKKVVRTPPAVSILPGITRDTVMEIARWQGVSVEEASLSRDDVYTADEAFFTGTAAEVTPIREVDPRQIGEGGPGPVTRRIRETFFDVVGGKEPTFSEWLTPV